MTIAVRVPFVDLRAQHAGIRRDVEQAVRRVFDDTDFILGGEVAAFEREFAEYLGARHVIGVANGTDALLLSLKALGVGPGDEVITAANTFIATAEAIVHAGARPVFVDTDPHMYTIDVKQIEARITPLTKAIIPVHLYGQPADLAPIMELAKTRGLHVVEDAAQAHGAVYRGRRVGTWGHLACFSFYPAKNLGAYGDAGAVATNDERLALTVRKLSNHGGTEKYQHDLIGYNSRLDTVQAAVLRLKLRHLDTWNRMRQEHARLYDRLLGGVAGAVTPSVADGASHVYHLYVIRVGQGRREALRQYLHDRGVHTGIHYPQPLHRTTPFRRAPYVHQSFPVAESYADAILSLPMYAELEREQIEYVAEQVRHFLAART